MRSRNASVAPSRHLGDPCPRPCCWPTTGSSIQKLVGLSFANEDIDLAHLDNGDDAIARARRPKPDVVLADVVMPGKSGYEVCEAIKPDPSSAHPVLLLTGTFEAFDEDRARSRGRRRPHHQALRGPGPGRSGERPPRPGRRACPGPAPPPSSRGRTDALPGGLPGSALGAGTQPGRRRGLRFLRR